MNNNYTEEVFESIKHINEYGQEFWYAREFQKVLEYTEEQNLTGTRKEDRLSQAMNNAPTDHFVDVDKIVHLGVADRKIISIFMLSRYACYLIVMNGDSRKKSLLLDKHILQ